MGYTRVLNKYHWMYSATAYNHAYNDSGIFCIHASSHPQSLVELTQVLVRELVAITGRISEDELNRIGRQMLDSKAAVAAIGSLKKMPSFNDIEIGLLDKEGALPNKRRFNLFR